MTDQTVAMAGLVLELPAGWADLTDELSSGGAPTYGKTKDGIGVLRLTTASYRGGPRPVIAADNLKALLEEFFRNNGYGTPTARTSSADGLGAASADYSDDTKHMRIWFLSNGVDVAFVTWVTLDVSSDLLEGELSEAEQLVRSIQFPRQCPLNNCGG